MVIALTSELIILWILLAPFIKDPPHPLQHYLIPTQLRECDNSLLFHPTAEDTVALRRQGSLGLELE